MKARNNNGVAGNYATKMNADTKCQDIKIDRNMFEQKETNFKTIAETRNEIEATAKRMAEYMEELNNIVQDLARGANPEAEISFDAYMELPYAEKIKLFKKG